MNYIDAHVHVWTPDTEHYPLAKGFTKEKMQPPSFTPEELFRHCKPLGVNRINLIQMSYYGTDNSYMLHMMALHKDVFVGTAIVDPHGEQADRLMTELAAKRVRAFRIQPEMSKLPVARWLEPAGFAAMFAAGARNNQAMSCLMDPRGLPELDRMCQRFPETPVIIDHICRIGIDGQIRADDVQALCAMAKHRRVLIKIGAFYALGKKQPPYTDLDPLIKQVIQAFGVQRCMWESDSPFQVQPPHTYRASIELVQKHLDFLSVEDRDWLLRRTAEEFFFKT